MMLSVYEIVQFLREKGIAFEVKGNVDVCVDNYCSLNSLNNKKVTWVKYWTEENVNSINSFQNIVVIGKREAVEISGDNKCLILCDNPKMCFFELLHHFYAKGEERKISSTAVVETDIIGQDCSIGHYSVIGKDVVIGEHVTIGNHVALQGRVIIGDYVTIQSGCVIGKSGYGYFKTVDGHMKKVPHLGGVRIDSFVEIGANTCIDCGTMDDTVIEKYVKIDNLCHIAHNVHISDGSMVIAQSMLGGSSSLEKNAYIAPGVLVMNQIKVGKNALVGMGAVVTKDVPEGKVVAGVPAKVLRDNVEESR